MPAGDRLDADRIAGAAGPWGPVEVVGSTGSTNADLAAAARAGGDHRRVLLADTQRAGRGRLGRSWSSPAGSGVALSVLFRPARPAGAWTWLPLVAGLAVADALAALGAPAGLKWPNDVLATAGGKLAGVLAERVDTAAGPACVLGMGINVGQTAEQLPVPGATSLEVLLGARRPSRTAVVLAVLAALDLGYGRWASGADAELRAAYLERSATVGRPVRVLLPDGTEAHGVAETVDADGRLVLATDGGRRFLTAADVQHLR